MCQGTNDINTYIYIIKVSNLPRVAVTQDMEKPNKHILLSLKKYLISVKTKMPLLVENTFVVR